MYNDLISIKFEIYIYLYYIYIGKYIKYLLYFISYLIGKKIKNKNSKNSHKYLPF